MRHLSTLIFLTILCGLGHIALANGGPSPMVQVKKNVQSCSGPVVPGQKGKPQQEASATTAKVEVVEVEAVAVPIVQEPSSPIAVAGKETKEVNKAAEVKKESSNLTFNFLYYIFYKFSVTDFFQTPSYNSSGI